MLPDDISQLRKLLNCWQLLGLLRGRGGGCFIFMLNPFIHYRDFEFTGPWLLSLWHGISECHSLSPGEDFSWTSLKPEWGCKRLNMQLREQGTGQGCILSSEPGCTLRWVCDTEKLFFPSGLSVPKWKERWQFLSPVVPVRIFASVVSHVPGAVSGRGRCLIEAHGFLPAPRPVHRPGHPSLPTGPCCPNSLACFSSVVRLGLDIWPWSVSQTNKARDQIILRGCWLFSRVFFFIASLLWHQHRTSCVYILTSEGRRGKRLT